MLLLPAIKNRFGSSLVNPAWAVIEYLSYPILVFATTPYFLKTLGIEQYGLWMLLMAIVNIGAVLNIGTGAATVKKISAEIGKENNKGVESGVRGSLAVALIGGGALAFIIGAVFWFAGDLLFSKVAALVFLRATGIAAGVLCWIEQIDNVFASVLKGAEKFGLAARAEMLCKIGQIATCVLTLCLGGQLEWLYAALVFSSIVRLAAKLIIVRRTLKLAAMAPAISSAHEILHFSKWGWIQGIGGMLFNIADRFLVGSLLGGSSLATYSIALQLAVQIHGLAGAGLSVVFPMVSRKRESDPSFSLIKTTKLILIGNLALSSVLALCLILFGKIILIEWLGQAQGQAVNKVLGYLTAAYWLLALNITPYYILLGLGKIKSVAFWGLAGGTIGIVPTIYGIQYFGLSGAAIGRLIYAIVTLVLFVPLVQALLSEKKYDRNMEFAKI